MLSVVVHHLGCFHPQERVRHQGDSQPLVCVHHRGYSHPLGCIHHPRFVHHQEYVSLPMSVGFRFNMRVNYWILSGRLLRRNGCSSKNKNLLQKKWGKIASQLPNGVAKMWMLKISCLPRVALWMAEHGLDLFDGDVEPKTLHRACWAAQWADGASL